MNIEKSYSIEEAIEIIHKTIDACSPDDIKCEFYKDHAYLSINRGWGIGCDTFINMSLVYKNFADKQDISGVGTAYEVTPKFDISWSSTGRTVPQAVATIKCYTDMVNLIALIEARLTERPLYCIIPND